MRCLYCGKPLPLLKKLTGGGEFCSDAHRHKYQEEYNKLALSRLLQAQSAPGETGVFPAPGGTGLRQLAAPMPPQPFAGQRALPAPSMPALSAGPPALPPPQVAPSKVQTPTAHHQEEKLTPSVPDALRAAVAPPPRPRHDIRPDPKEAPFIFRRHEAIAPTQSAVIKSELDLLVADFKPQVLDHATLALEVVPFEWESVNAAITASQEPDPPEAPAWRHPIEIQTPVAPLAPCLAAFPFELFPSRPVRPAQPEVSLGSRYPQSVRPKLNFAVEKDAFRVARGDFRLSDARDWELNLKAPAWHPSFLTISAPAPPPIVAMAKNAGSLSVATASQPAKTIDKQTAQSQEPRANMEVFIDLSVLGIFDDAPPRL